MKLLVEEGNSCIDSPIDALTLAKTHALRWLAQIVCQIIRTARWENEFQCEGVGNLAEFSAVVEELETMYLVGNGRLSSKPLDGSTPVGLQASNVVRFAKKLDALLHLIEATTEILGATLDANREESSYKPFAQGPGKYTIH